MPICLFCPLTVSAMDCIHSIADSTYYLLILLILLAVPICFGIMKDSVGQLGISGPSRNVMSNSNSTITHIHRQ